MTALARRRRSVLVAWLLTTLAACALWTDPTRIAPGTPAGEVRTTLGTPSAHYPATGALPARLQYSVQPAGQRVYNVDLDAAGRVLRVEQALQEPLFAQRIQPGVWTRDDVLREYGAPARTLRVHNFDGDIWLWRYLDGPTWRQLFIDLDRAGVVRGHSSGDEPLPDPPDAH